MTIRISADDLKKNAERMRAMHEDATQNCGITLEEQRALDEGLMRFVDDAPRRMWEMIHRRGPDPTPTGDATQPTTKPR